MSHTLTKQEVQTIAPLQIITTLLKEISSGARTATYTTETNIVDVYRDIGSTAWLEFYERLKEIYGPYFWDDGCYNTLGDVCGRIDVIQREAVAKHSKSRNDCQKPVSKRLLNTAAHLRRRDAFADIRYLKERTRNKGMQKYNGRHQVQ